MEPVANHTPATTEVRTATGRPVKVWDLPTRVFHWTLVLAFGGLFVTGMLGGSWMTWHFRIGYLAGSLLIFRWVWGCVGGHYSRFHQFLKGPVAILRYLKHGVSGAGLGHNPLGALSVMAMLVMLSVQVAMGLFADDGIAYSGPLSYLLDEKSVSALSKLHRWVGKWVIPGLVCLHVLAIAYYRWYRGHKLVSAMWTGWQSSTEPEAPQSKDGLAQRALALGIWSVGACLFWWLSTRG